MRFKQGIRSAAPLGGLIALLSVSAGVGAEAVAPSRDASLTLDVVEVVGDPLGYRAALADMSGQTIARVRDAVAMQQLREMRAAMRENYAFLVASLDAFDAKTLENEPTASAPRAESVLEGF